LFIDFYFALRVALTRLWGSSCYVCLRFRKLSVALLAYALQNGGWSANLCAAVQPYQNLT
jgi:hypothetical protein